jgi:hypothetical protein
MFIVRACGIDVGHPFAVVFWNRFATPSVRIFHRFHRLQHVGFIKRVVL